MHLALIISSLNSGGAQRVLSDLANDWAAKGNEVTLITLASPDAKLFYPLDTKVQLIQLNQTQPVSSFLSRLVNIYKRVFCLRKTLKILKPDVVISFVDVMNLTTLLASAGFTIPVIVSERTHPAYHQLPCVYRCLRTLLYPKAFRVVIQTHSAANYFKHLKNLIVIPNAVKEPCIKKTLFLDRASNIISVGRLCPFKGFDTLIHAFARLYPSYPELRLTIYGEGEERKNLQNLIQSLNLEEKVSLPGAVQDIQQKLAAADLFVFPSLYEGFPNALCEAMSIGLPVIASNCSGNIEIIKDDRDGRLFPIGDVSKLTALIEELVNSRDTRKRLGEAAMTIHERLHRDRIFELWDQVISEAAGHII